jgi:hypothetical protein
VNEISNDDNSVARAARLAPSARNTQPWQFTFNDKELVINYQGRGLFKGLMKKKLSKIDLGIVLRCAETALVRYGEKVRGIEVNDDEDDISIRISY